MIGIIIQARLNSSRLPKKIFRKVLDISLLEHLLRRLVTTPYKIILAVPDRDKKEFKKAVTQFNESDFIKKRIIEKTDNNHSSINDTNISVFTGSEDDVLSRYVGAATTYNLSTLIRVTGDNPLTSEKCLRDALKHHLRDHNDLTYLEGWPYGAGVEIISLDALKKSQRLTKSSFEKEHVTQCIYKHPDVFKIKSYPVDANYLSDIRVTVDTIEDLRHFEHICKTVGLNEDGYVELLDVIRMKR